MTLKDKSQLIKQWVIEQGFDACGITKVREAREQKQHFLQWIEKKYHGQMSYMARNIDKRLNPALLVNEAKSIIVVLMNYKQPQNLLLKLKKYRISQYAWGLDYHYIIKQRLKKVLKLINEHFGPVNARIFTDSAPVLEIYWAQQAGLGWIGKNSLLITKQGSYFFIGEIILDLELYYDKPFKKNFCSSCNRCIEACPTNAIVSPQIVDARKCISYNTIEYKGEFEANVKLHNWIFGCDICQQVCPWNTKSKYTLIEEFYPKKELRQLSDEQLKNLSKEQFKQVFAKTPVVRTGFLGLMRNIKQVNLENNKNLNNL